MPATAARPRRVPPSTWKLRAHRVAVPVARAVLRLPRRRRAPVRAVPKVTILLVHAWGMGGTIRTMLTVAGWLARRHEVEVLSVWRTREKPFFAFPPGVTVTAADDRRRGAGGRTAKLLRRLPGCLLFPGDRTHRQMTLWSDVQLVRRLRASRPDVADRHAAGAQPARRARRRGARAGGVGAHRVLGLPRVAAARDLAPLPRGSTPWSCSAEPERAPLEGAAPVWVIPNAAPRCAGAPAPLEAPVVVAAGRLVGAKGFDRLIRAFTWVAEAHPGWRLRICGGGPERAALAALIAELRLGGRVELAGKVRDMEAELGAASVFALSSRVEGLPLALLEAMAKGLAVVSFDNCAGPREVIEHGADGLLVPGGDERALARAICALIESPDLRRRLGDGARIKAAGYGIETVGPRWDALIEALT